MQLSLDIERWRDFENVRKVYKAGITREDIDKMIVSIRPQKESLKGFSLDLLCRDLSRHSGYEILVAAILVEYEPLVSLLLEREADQRALISRMRLQRSVLSKSVRRIFGPSELTARTNSHQLWSSRHQSERTTAAWELLK